jgi:hypothetical protein
MFIKGNQGPIEVVLPDGAKLNRSDLPARTTTRWVASRKLVVVQAVVHNLIGFVEACDTYDLSEEELQSWIDNTNDYGPSALKVTTILKYRQP